MLHQRLELGRVGGHLSQARLFLFCTLPTMFVLIFFGIADGRKDRRLGNILECWAEAGHPVVPSIKGGGLLEVLWRLPRVFGAWAVIVRLQHVVIELVKVLFPFFCRDPPEV